MKNVTSANFYEELFCTLLHLFSSQFNLSKNVYEIGFYLWQPHVYLFIKYSYETINWMTDETWIFFFWTHWFSCQWWFINSFLSNYVAANWKAYLGSERSSAAKTFFLIYLHSASEQKIICELFFCQSIANTYCDWRSSGCSDIWYNCSNDW